jgi:serine/threonine-protein kinase
MADVLERLRAALADRYPIERELGSGGMATVYLADDLKLHRKVAVKVLRPELAAALGPDRFVQEIDIAAKLTHPHILPLHDCGDADGFLYYVMPHIEGESLRERLAHEGELPITEAVKILRDVADALDHAHKHGVVHRDIKPDNVLLSERHALVTDFGVAKAVSEATGRQQLTTEGVALGTPAYMSPEQAAADKHIDHRADIYAVGALAYELLAGRPPFIGTTPQEVLAAHVTQAVEPVTKHREKVPPALAQVVMKCLEKKPADRWQSAEELLPQLEALATPSGGMTPAETQPVRVTPPRRKSRAVAIAGGLVLVIGVGALVLRQPLGALFGGDAPAAVEASQRPWVIVAAFEGGDDDHTLGETAQALVSTGLDQSEIVATVPRPQLGTVLRAAGRSDTVRIDPALARELAVRSLVGTVVEGRIDPIGETFSILLRAVNAVDGAVIASARGVANSDRDLVPRLDELTREILGGLGDRSAAGIASDRPLASFATPSFEAFGKFVQGLDLYFLSDMTGSRALLDQALALDPDFALAWMYKGHSFWTSGPRDSVEANYAEALRRPERLTEGRRADIEALLALHRNDLRTALRIYDRLSNQGLGYDHNRGLTLGHLRRHDESAAAYRQALARQFRPSPGTLANLSARLLYLGEFDEVRAIYSQLDSLGRLGTRTRALTVAALDRDWQEQERLGRAMWDDPAASAGQQRTGAYSVAAAQAARGRIADARQTLVGIREAALAQGNTGARGPVVGQMRLSWYSGATSPSPRPAEIWGTTARGLATHARWAAFTGDTAAARRSLSTLVARPAEDVTRYGEVPVFIEAAIAAQGDRWAEVVELLAPSATRGHDIGYLEFQTNRIERQWLVADAYEQLGRPDSAASFLERIVAPEGSGGEIRRRGLTYSFAHRRLARLYTQLEESDRAEEHWLEFLDAFTDPDPEFQWMLDEARSELERLGRGR